MPSHSVPRSTPRCRAALLGAAVQLVAACNGGVGPNTPLTYRVIAGACGDVVFVERIGTDSASAIEVVEVREVEQFGEGDVLLDPYRLEVVDEHHRSPAPRFYALRALSGDSGMFLHSVFEVITTDGDLFHLRWCPD